MATSDGPPTDKEVLYSECEKVCLSSAEKFEKQFTQTELLGVCKDTGLDKFFDGPTLLPLLSALSTDCLFRAGTARSGNTLYWSLRSRELAKRLRALSAEERIVYVAIEQSGTNGVWSRNIKKTNRLTDQGLNKATARLEKLQLVKAVKNIKAPAQKTFMLFWLAADDSVTGGSFYDGGELDETLVEELGNVIIFHVRQAGWVEEKRRKVKREHTEAITLLADNEARGSSPEEVRGRKKRKVSQSQDIEDAGPARKANRREREGHVHVQLFHPAGYEYPDVHDIHRYIMNNDIIRDAKQSTLSVDEVQNIINMLLWDGKLERVNGGYRTVRGIKMPTMSGQDDEDEPVSTRLLDTPERRGNGLTEMPCGRCPVLHVCGKGGPINASSCVYFDQWLGLAVNGQGDRAAMEVEIVR